MKPDFYEDEEWELGKWLSAALEDTDICKEFRNDINNWFEMLERRKENDPPSY